MAAEDRTSIAIFSAVFEERQDKQLARPLMGNNPSAHSENDAVQGVSKRVAGAIVRQLRIVPRRNKRPLTGASMRRLRRIHPDRLPCITLCAGVDPTAFSQARRRPTWIAGQTIFRFKVEDRHLR